MNRQEKKESISELKDKFSKSQAAILADYRGVSVETLTKMRKKLHAGKTEFKIVKNTLAELAVKDTSYSNLSGSFADTTAVAFVYGDPAAASKVLTEFIDIPKPIVIKKGYLKEKPLSLEDIKKLAKLPSRDVLLSMMLSAVQGPLRNLHGVLSALPRNLVNVLAAVKNKKS